MANGEPTAPAATAPVRSSVSYTIRVPEDVDRSIQNILDQAERGVSRNEVINDLLRAAILEREGGGPPDPYAILQDQLGQIDARNHLYMDILIFMQARCFANILSILERNTQLQSSDFIRRAVETAFKEGPVLNGQLHYEQDRVDWIVAKPPQNMG